MSKLAIAQTMQPSPAGGDYLKFPVVETEHGLRKGTALGLVDHPPEAFRQIDLGITIDGWLFFEALPAYHEAFMLFQKPEGFQFIIKGSKKAGVISAQSLSRWQQRDGRGGSSRGGSYTFELKLKTWYYFYCQFEGQYEDLAYDINLPLAIGAKCFHFDLLQPEHEPLRLILEYLPFVGGIDELRISKTLRYPRTSGNYAFIGNSPSPERGLFELPQKAFEPDEHTIALWHFDDPNAFFVDAKNCWLIRPYGWLEPTLEKPEPWLSYSPPGIGLREPEPIIATVKLVSTTDPQFITIDLANAYTRPHHSMKVGSSNNASFATWFEQPNITYKGVPFLVGTAGNDVVASRNNSQNRFTLQGIQRQCRRLHFLLSGYMFPPDYLTVKLHYADGSSDTLTLRLYEWTHAQGDVAFDFNSTVGYNHAAVNYEAVDVPQAEKVIASIESQGTSFILIGLTLELEADR